MKLSPLKFIQESRANAHNRTRRIVTVTITIVVIIAKKRIVATFEYRVARINEISVGRQYSTYVFNLYFLNILLILFFVFCLSILCISIYSLLLFGFFICTFAIYIFSSIVLSSKGRLKVPSQRTSPHETKCN